MATFHPVVRVTPDPRYVAEVVVLLTTLGAKRTEYNAGKRVKDMFEIKRVHFKPVDFNRDARQAGSGEAANKAIQKLINQGKLQTGENDDTLILPQIFIDGQYIGGIDDLQGLEDEGRLDRILLRQDPTWQIDEIIPGEMTIEQLLQELAMQGGDEEYFDDDDYDSEYDEEEEEEDGGAGHR